jgi:hypothetical protein
LKDVSKRDATESTIAPRAAFGRLSRIGIVGAAALVGFYLDECDRTERDSAIPLENLGGFLSNATTALAEFIRHLDEVFDSASATITAARAD